MYKLLETMLRTTLIFSHILHSRSTSDYAANAGGPDVQGPPLLERPWRAETDPFDAMPSPCEIIDQSVQQNPVSPNLLNAYTASLTYDK